MGKNYKETRERLRRLLHKKKTKRRAAPNVTVSDKNEKPVPAPVTPVTAPSAPVPGAAPPQAQNQELNKKSRSLEDLLDFIEGNESVCRNEKKAAKRARQKEKKLQLILQLKREEEERVRQLEEERLRKEREAEMLENLRKVAAKKKKSKKKKKNANNAEVPNPPHPQQKKTNFSLGQSGGSNPGAQMVTIKRVMEPHDSEPTVTITLRGATPKQDKVLYTLFNGKVCESLKNPPKGPKNPKDLKNIKETEKNTVSVKKVVPQKIQPLIPTTSRVESKVHKSNLSYQMPSRPSKELTNPTSIQISNAVTNMTKNGYHDFNFDGIKLPPGITITKVDPCHKKIKSTSKMEEDAKNQVSLKPVPKPPKKAPTPEVIIVSTNKLKQDANPTSRIVKPGDINKLSGSCSGTSKKQKKKKENDASSKSKMASSYPGLDIEIIKPSDDQAAAELCNQMSVLTINPYADCKGDEPEQPVKTSKKKRKKKKKSKAEGGADAEDWNTLENVFAPKDLDLNDGEIDDAERELEAFKLFCMQSVPLKRKEKVNLNLKDLVLKKKSVSCS
uniref:FAM193 C-terminal domain-containing protein n=1 Tax=Lygus hesperus TaxID=30085 RepID=A0A0A9Y4M0_LYGHE